MTPGSPLPDAHLRVLRALQAGAELVRHTRLARGPYYTLAGRRLSVVLLGELESRRLIAREGRDHAGYHLTPAGERALAEGEGTDSLRLP